ncbi:hypothetical protein TBLA_0B10070 [Henningerozyma blattae CBS 6284]|uniref:Alpha-factor-transporting ATPase n=1 Tax=Henningerozyma blattae (strain ATCC 34711 / CBS 6284 / DSM 70876 / NBRC 10599 / NRRL Y-10934 / UCD 77-7) TaxID=1071380 RepID=I2H0C2_HENB6|nr:hypothetical protein TBLA_0B10070 [Tetrapisispora blattae CBS 6284]CCH59824.1 hypothetical protein TBLA_0B10070 [Tetrapisispora blattae CBS 6284]
MIPLLKQKISALKKKARINIYMHINFHDDYKLLFLISLSTLANGLVPTISSILTGRIFAILKDFVNPELSKSQIHNKLTLNTMSIMILGVGCFPIMWTCISTWMSIGERQGIKVRTKILNNYLTQSMTWYDLNEQLQGDFTQLHRCVEELRSSSAEASAVTFQNCIAIIALIATSFYYSWSLTLIILCSTPIICIFSICFSIMIQKFANLENNETTVSAQIFTETIQNIQLIKLNNLQLKKLMKFQTSISKCNKFFIQMCLYVSLNTSILRTLTLLMFVQGFWFGSTMIRKGHLKIDEVITCFSSCLLLGSIISNTLHQIVVLQKGEVALQKIVDFLDEADDPLEINSAPITLINSNISFQNISFAYPSRPNENILNQINLYFQNSATTFIVGKSGSGKSTLSNLLLKFYETYKGDILIDNINIKNLNQKNLLDNIMIVEQKCTLFNDTIRNNILFGVSNFTNQYASNRPNLNERLKNACTFALLDHFLIDLPNGIDTVIGTGGITLSGGQQQRVALARAYMRDPPILILDEAVSALDVNIRELLMKAIKLWRSNKTTIILTHDLTQIDNDDFLYVIKHGRIIEHGKRKELITDPNTEFHKLVAIQNNNNLNEDFDLETDTFNGSPRDEKNYIEVDYEADTPKAEKYSSIFYEENDYIINFSSPRKKSQRFTISESIKESSEYPISNSSILTVEASMEQIKNEPFELLPIFKIIKFMLKTTNHRVYLGIGLIFAIFAGATNPIFSWAFSYLLAGIAPTLKDIGSVHYLIKWSCIVIGITIIDGISNFFKGFLLGICSEYWIMDLRDKFMKEILRKKIQWFSDEKYQTAEMSALILNDLRDLRSLVSEFMSAMATFIVVSLFGLIWALVTGWKLALVCIAMFPLIIIFSAIYGAVLQKSETDYKSSVANLENIEFDIVSNIKTIKSLQLEGHFYHNYKVAETKLKNVATKRSIYTGLGISITNTITMCIQAILYYYGFKLIMDGEYTVKQMFTTFTLLLFTVMTCNSLVNQIPDMSRGQRAASWVYSILQQSDDTKEVNDPNSIIVDNNTISNDFPILDIKNLTFAYESTPSIKVLDGLTLKLFPGDKLAIAGESGCGKTTLLSLLVKFYDVDPNQIYFNGKDILNYEFESLRDAIVIVEQKPSVLSGSIRDNLLGNNKRLISDYELYDVLKLTGIFDFIETLPSGIDTIIDTTLLSGGQAQRICIARALLRKPKILILDECTSALDAMSADIINNLVSKELNGVTIISITHSESMMTSCQNVAVLKNGKIVEVGTYDSLATSSSHLGKLLSKIREE